MSPRPTRAPIRNEAANGLDNDRYTVAMARTSAVDSATDQFFINTVDNEFLNHQVRDYGYAVFGRVIDGTDVGGPDRGDTGHQLRSQRRRSSSNPRAGARGPGRSGPAMLESRANA